MRKALITLAISLMATTATAQVEQDILEDLLRDFGDDVIPDRGEITSRVVDGAVLRGLDTLNGTVSIFAVPVGQTVDYERLTIDLEACRIPAEGEKPDGYAFLHIQDQREDAPQFSGWMIASSPALNALDHPRYDIWVDRCYEGEMPELPTLERVSADRTLQPAPQDQ
ncbi:DUF2155 domain-containing protein [Pontivivens insulae]|uniref:DUF2155 domain-containing protein n=1 Tax=Pontivivens insulae TaxID=1639689 RepID=A0A2R8AB58_9RHOB|nr:DUF2155 domain-containing protein [Pontivivens insulae]RED11364.1 uncharacterized protein DUF2155 [Pontivivens insulae]SPF29463.1 hypothetical protein POI8812_01773 [Pontivivens insulae]